MPPPTSSTTQAEDTPIVAAARGYLARQWRPIPVPRAEKAPTRSKWQHVGVIVDDFRQYFPGGHENIGLLLGDPSGGLADVDLDAGEAIATVWRAA